MEKRKRNQTISIRLTLAEKKEILAKAMQAQMTLTDYLIECSRNTDITVTDLSEVLEKLTPEILRAFIKRIDVYEKEVRYSRTCGNTIVIQYTFQLGKN